MGTIPTAVVVVQLRFNGSSCMHKSLSWCAHGQLVQRDTMHANGPFTESRVGHKFAGITLCIHLTGRHLHSPCQPYDPALTQTEKSLWDSPYFLDEPQV